MQPHLIADDKNVVWNILVCKYTPPFLLLKAKRIMQYTVYSST